MIEEMATVRISEAELARDLHAVLEKVGEGIEVIVEQDHRPVAVTRPALPKGRLLSECIALAEARGTTAIPDEGFMGNVGETWGQTGNVGTDGPFPLTSLDLFDRRDLPLASTAVRD